MLMIQNLMYTVTELRPTCYFFFHICLKIVCLIFGLKYSPLPFINMHSGSSPVSLFLYRASSPHSHMLILTSLSICLDMLTLLQPFCSPRTPYFPISLHHDDPVRAVCLSNVLVYRCVASWCSCFHFLFPTELLPILKNFNR